MAKTKQITVSIGRTINLKDFNSLRVDASVTKELREEEDYQTVWDRAWKEVQEEVEKIVGN